MNNSKEIEICLRKMGLTTLPEILKRYNDGELDEESLNEELMEWQVNFNDEFLQTELPYTGQYITFSETDLIPSGIRSIKRDEKINFTTNSLDYRIVINECNEEKNVPHANTIFCFHDIEERDKQYKILRDKLILLGIRFR